MKQCASFTAAALLAAFLFTGWLRGQRTSASISGVVTDPSGALVAGANVTVTQVATAAPATVRTGAEGFYVLSNLQPGAYRLRIEVAGFQSYERTGITLQVGQAATVNVTLQLGSPSEAVTVTAEPALVDTRTQTVSFAITPQFTEEIPLNGRNVLQLMALAPDTSEHQGTNYSNQLATRPETAASGFITASGESRENSTTFYLDGGLNEDTYTAVSNIFPNPDAIQEFTFETNSYNAKYGGRGGGIVNAVTRSGSNQIHGTAYEYLRNGNLNARNFFAADHDTLNRNQFGFSVGAPIQKDKTFGFLAFQRTTFRFGTTTGVAFGPTPAELAGDWSAIPWQLKNPVTGEPFANNQVPASLYHPISLKVLDLVPHGDAANGQITYLSRQLQNDSQWVARLDRNIGDKFRIFGSYLWDGLDNPNLADKSNILTGGPNQNWASQHGAINATYSFGPNLVATAGATLSRVLIRYSGSDLFPSLPDLGARYPVWDPQGVHEVGFYIDGWFTAYWLGAYNVSRTQTDFTNNWTYTRSNHTLDFGAELAQSLSIVSQAYVSSGYEGWWCANSGYSPLDFMLGANCFFEQFAPSYDAPRGHEPSLYLNDTWRVKPRLTLNLGMRWEPWLPWPDSSAGKLGGVFDLAAYAAGQRSTRYPNLPPGYLIRGDAGVPGGLVPSNWKLFDPRVGLAWDVTGNGKTSLRAGFGIYHDRPFGRMYNMMMSTVPFTQGGYIYDTSVSAYDPYQTAPYNGTLPVLQSPPPPDTVFPMPLSSAIGFSRDFKPPATLQWNLTLERELGRGTVLRVGYEASKSYHMFDSRDINAAENGVRPMANDYGGTVIVDESAVSSSYNALALTAEKRMSGNLSFLGGFRWAKCLDEGSTTTFAYEEFTVANNRRLDRGLCNSDVGAQFKMAVVWRVPTFSRFGFVGRNVLGGWQMSGIWTSRDGIPYSVGASGDANLDGTVNDRANIVGNASLPGGRSTSEKLAQWFNTAAFAQPAPGNAGTSGRNILRGPGFMNLDYSLVKTFALKFGPFAETQKIAFRAEFFNALNHPNFSNPNYGMGTTSFGQILSAYDPRILQFALKYSF